MILITLHVVHNLSNSNKLMPYPMKTNNFQIKINTNNNKNKNECDHYNLLSVFKNYQFIILIN